MLSNIDPCDIDDISQLPPGVDLYIAMWDRDGLEYLFNLSQWDRKRVLAELTGVSLPPQEKPAHPGHLVMRARVNSQRHYEMYTFTVDNNIDEGTLRQAFIDNPQPIVDHIRVNGSCIHSDRRNSDKPVIV